MAAIIAQTREARRAQKRRDAAQTQEPAVYTIPAAEYDRLLAAIARVTGLPAPMHSIELLCTLLENLREAMHERIRQRLAEAVTQAAADRKARRQAEDALAQARERAALEASGVEELLATLELLERENDELRLALTQAAQRQEETR
jgi:hypothetical protein